MSTTIQILVFPSDSTFDQPSTPAGQQWKSAICYLTDYCPKLSAAWGRHFEAREKVTLIIEWNTTPTARIFLTEHYIPFAALLEPLLATPADLPYVTDINTSALADPVGYPGGGGLTTLTKLTYSSLSDGQRGYLIPTTFDMWIQDLDWALGLGKDGAAGYKSGDVGWAVEAASGARTATLFMVTSWKSLEAEQECEKKLMTYHETDAKNLKEAVLGRALAQADPDGEVWHVEWDVLWPYMLAYWKDSENPTWPYEPLKAGQK